MFSAVTILVIALSTYLLSRFLSRRRKRTKITLPPGPSPRPINIGSLTQMLNEASKYKWIKRLMNDFKRNIVCIRIGNVHVIYVADRKIASEILKEKGSIFASRAMSLGAAALGHNYLGPITAPIGKQWSKIRKMTSAELISPAMYKWFFLNKRTEEENNIIEYVTNQPDGIVDLRKTTFMYSTNIIKRLMFNTRYFGEPMPDKAGPGPAEEDYTHNIMTALTYIFALSDFIPILTGLDLEGKEKIAVDAIKNVEKYQNPIIEERVRKWRNRAVSINNEEASKEDMVDIMINLKDSDGKPLLSEEEIKAVANELVLGTTDNVANAVEWAMGEMLNEPSIMKKAMEELDEVVGKDRVVDESDIPKLKYMKAILMESFRLHPVNPFIPPRVATEDSTVGGYLIPKGSHILISRRDLNRNPDVWENPLSFNPDRHMENVVITNHELGFMSFGVGRRACPGRALGTAMSIMLLARLLQAFDWSLAPGGIEVDLKECEEGLNLMATPLVACASPRLSSHLYKF